MAITTFMSPVVSFSEIDLSAYNTQSPVGSVGGTVGTFQWGPVDEVVTIGSERNLADIFGLPFYKKGKKELNRYIDWFSCSNFLSYSNTLKVARCCYPHARNSQVQLYYSFNRDPYGEIVGLNLNDPIRQLTIEDQDETLVKNDVDFENKKTTIENRKIAFIAKYPGCFPEGIHIAIAGNDGYREIKDEDGTRLTENPFYIEWRPSTPTSAAYLKVTIIHPNHMDYFSEYGGLRVGDKVSLSGLRYIVNGLTPTNLNTDHTVQSINNDGAYYTYGTGSGAITVEGYTVHIPYVGSPSGLTQFRYFAGMPGLPSGFYQGRQAPGNVNQWQWRTGVNTFNDNHPENTIYADVDAANATDPGQFGGDEIYVRKHSHYWSRAYKSVFTSEPLPGEFHILLIDPTGEISGSRLPGTILEKFSNVSVHPSKKYDGTSNYISNVVNRGSRFVNVGDINYLIDNDDFVHDALVLQGGEDSMFNYAFPEATTNSRMGKRTFFDFVSAKVAFGNMMINQFNREYTHIQLRQIGGLLDVGDTVVINGYQCEWGKDPNSWPVDTQLSQNIYWQAEYEKQLSLTKAPLKFKGADLLSPLGSFSKSEDMRVNGNGYLPRRIVFADRTREIYYVETVRQRMVYPALNIVAINDTSAAYADPANFNSIGDDLAGTDPDFPGIFKSGSAGTGTRVEVMVGCADKNFNWYANHKINNAYNTTANWSHMPGVVLTEEARHYLDEIALDTFGIPKFSLVFKARVTITSSEGIGYSAHTVFGRILSTNTLELFYVNAEPISGTSQIHSSLINQASFPWGDVYDEQADIQIPGIGTVHVGLDSMTTPGTEEPWSAISPNILPGYGASAASVYNGTLGFIEILEFYNNLSGEQLVIPNVSALNKQPSTDELNNINVSVSPNARQQNILRIESLDSTQTGSLAMRMRTWDLFLDEDRVDTGLLFAGEGGPELSKYLIENICMVRKDCIAVVDPFYSDVVNVASPVAIVRNLKATRNMVGSSSYGVMVSAWKYQFDKFNDEYHWLPPGGDICGIISRVDYDTFPWYSPAGLNRGHLKNVIKLSHHEPLYMRDELYVNGINPIVSFPTEGVVLYGDKTLQSRPSAFDRINVRRLFIFLQKSIVKNSRYFVFELNDEFTREALRINIGSFMAWVKSNRGCYAYNVICDETNNTPEIIDRNELYADIFVQPVKSINFIQLNFIATRTGASMTIQGEGA